MPLVLVGAFKSFLLLYGFNAAIILHVWLIDHPSIRGYG